MHQPFQPVLPFPAVSLDEKAPRESVLRDLASSYERDGFVIFPSSLFAETSAIAASAQGFKSFDRFARRGQTRGVILCRDLSESFDKTTVAFVQSVDASGVEKIASPIARADRLIVGDIIVNIYHPGNFIPPHRDNDFVKPLEAILLLKVEGSDAALAIQSRTGEWIRPRFAEGDALLLRADLLHQVPPTRAERKTAVIEFRKDPLSVSP